MANIKDTVTVATGASSGVNTKKYQQNHVTTQCFLRPVPVFAREKKAGSDFKVKHEDFVRCDPMPVPTFGRAMVYDRAFFVPFRTIFKDWNDFIVQSPTYGSGLTLQYASNTPLISNTTMLSVLTGLASLAGSNNPDFSVNDGNGNLTNYIHTSQSSYFYKVMLSLGYGINFRLDDSSEWSALPLYAFMKIILDWYYPSQYAYNNVFANVEYYFQCHNASGTPMPFSTIIQFFTTMAYCKYDDDYFVSAWDNPVGPNAAFEKGMAITDITNNTSISRAIVTNDSSVGGSPAGVNRPSNNTPMIAGTNNFFTSPSSNGVAQSVITQYVVDALRSMTDYTKRHQLAGVRAVDRYLAEYGVNLSSEILRRSLYLGYNSFPLQFGDVMSHSDTSDQGGDRLGDYAGKGFGYGNGIFGYDDKNEFGMFIIVNTIVPQVGFFQGQVRDTMHITPMDFWHGDYDHLGVQAIAKRELLIPSDSTTSNSVPATLNDGVFAFIPRYAEYACGYDRVTGTYREPSHNLGLSSYYLMRELPDSADLTHQVAFALGSDFLEYNRMFYETKGVWDFFNFVHHFEVEYEDESKPLWDEYDFENKVKQVKMNIGGTTVQ